VDIPSFLATYPPFDELEEERLGEVVRHTHIEFHPAGSMILAQSGEPSSYLYVVRTGAVEVMDGMHVTDVLGEGEVFGQFSLLSGLGPAFSIRAAEDTICYLVDEAIAEEVMGTREGLAFLSATLRRREVRALEGIDPAAVDPWQTPVGTLIHRPPVLAPVTFSIREAAELMTRERVSSVLFDRNGELGILTDRDLRSRVLADGRDPATGVEQVMTSPVVTVSRDAMVAEVTSLMLERGVHHVPVLGEAGELLGVVTDTDLLGLEQKTPFSLKVDIERAIDATAAVQAAGRLPETVCALVEANIDPLDVAHAIAVVVDTLTRRLLEVGLRTFGDPPCPWSWLALGSEARQEQALLTDQDNALVVGSGDESLDAVDPYFDRLAGFVNDHLAGAGFPKCRAGVIASNREWRGTLLDWEARFHGWIEDPGRTGTAFTGIAFDYRPIAGPLEVRATLDEAIRSAAGEAQFLRQLGKLAVEGRPPSGFLKDAVVEGRGRSAVTLDVKRAGITPISNLARVYAISAGLSENRTLRRLRDVQLLGGIDDETRRGLEEAFRLLWQIRLEHQTRQVRAGVPADDAVDARALGPLARTGLKEAFRMIERAQERLATAFGIRR
jgi:CBS domain-containing protein